jgi:hypothetical protein
LENVREILEGLPEDAAADPANRPIGLFDPRPSHPALPEWVFELKKNEDRESVPRTKGRRR